MNHRYCVFAGCGSSNPYTSIRPTVCEKCHRPFEMAFVPVASPSVASSPRPTLQYQPPQSNRTFRGARGRNPPPPIYSNPEPEQDGYQDGDEYVTRDDISAEAQALASTIKASDFLSVDVTFEEGATSKIRFDDLPEVQKALKAKQLQPPKSAVKAPRKSRKAK